MERNPILVRILRLRRASRCFTVLRIPPLIYSSEHCLPPRHSTVM